VPPLASTVNDDPHVLTLDHQAGGIDLPTELTQPVEVQQYDTQLDCADAAQYLLQLAAGHAQPSDRPTEVDVLLDEYDMQQYKDIFYNSGIVNITENVSKITERQLARLGLKVSYRTQFMKNIRDDQYACFANIDDRVSVYWSEHKKWYHGTVKKRELTCTTVLYDDGDERVEPNGLIHAAKCPKPGLCSTPGCILVDRHRGDCEINHCVTRTRR
jgi:hypothetical protein